MQHTPERSTGKKKVWRQPVFPEEGCGKTRSEINARYSTPVQLCSIGKSVLAHDHTSDKCHRRRPSDLENYHIFFRGQCENLDKSYSKTSVFQQPVIEDNTPGHRHVERELSGYRRYRLILSYHKYEIDFHDEPSATMYRHS